MPQKQSTEVVTQMQKVLVDIANEVNEWVGFSERTSKLTAPELVQTLVLGWLKTPEASLNELAQGARNLGVDITGSGINSRLQLPAVLLLAGVLQQSLKTLQTACPLPIAQLAQFEGIYITDSTQIALPQALYGAFRGTKTNAMVKLQVTWDYLHGNLATIELEEGRRPDQRCVLPVSHARPNTLHLFDLGYFNQDNLRDIDQQGAFLVSRYQSQTALYACDTHERLDLVAWLKSVTSDQAQRDILLGGRVKHPLRLIVRRLPEPVAAARRRAARRKARQNGRTPSAQHLFLQGWDIVVTNLPAATWSCDQVFDLYGIRFQIEWGFRVWKDQMALDYVGNWRIERVLCQLYAHLIAAVLTHYLTRAWRWDGQEYSFLKCVQLIQNACTDLMRCLARQGYGMYAWLNRLEDDFRTFGKKNKRRKSPSTLHIVNHWGLT